MAGSDMVPAFHAAEHHFDAAAAPIAVLVLSDPLVARSPAWDAGLDALGMELVPEPVGVVVGVAEQRWRSGIVADLPSSDRKARGAAVGVSNQLAEIPFLTRRLDAVRRALR